MTPPTADPAAPVTTVSYDTTGDETSATGAQPSYGTFTTGKELTATDGLGRTTPFSYDAAIWAADDNLGTPRDLINNSGLLANHRVSAPLDRTFTRAISRFPTSVPIVFPAGP